MMKNHRQPMASDAARGQADIGIVSSSGRPADYGGTEFAGSRQGRANSPVTITNTGGSNATPALIHNADSKSACRRQK